ncbi:MAG TPA: hypothetical protein VKB79_17360 [Bryobacteraceae bacterium]|nr:hypothetical protein [Bryobacteraceae bacterium]
MTTAEGQQRKSIGVLTAGQLVSPERPCAVGHRRKETGAFRVCGVLWINSADEYALIFSRLPDFQRVESAHADDLPQTSQNLPAQERGKEISPMPMSDLG